MRSWPAYVWSGAVALVVSWAISAVLSGCRIGNHTVEAQNPDQTSGYYQTQPQSLTFCASKPSDTCASANPSQVPELISSALSNPVTLVMQDLSTGYAVFTPPGGEGYALPIYVNPDDSLSVIENSAPQTAWKDPSCTTSLYLEEAGQLERGQGSQITINGATFQSAGRVSLNVQIIQSFDGDCAQTMQDMANCLQDVSQCQGVSDSDNQQQQGSIQALFNPYIQAGVMSVSDVPSVTDLSYQVQYE